MKKNIFVDTDKTYRPKRRPKVFALTGALNFTFLTKNMWFIAYLTLLGIIYVANSHQTAKTIMEIKRLKEQTKNSAWESNSRKSELMFNSMQSEVAKKTSPMGVHELTERPHKIVLEKD